jgi:cysteinyl-tRNA synthetase
VTARFSWNPGVLVAVAAALTAVLVACGSSKSSDGSTSATDAAGGATGGTRTEASSEGGSSTTSAASGTGGATSGAGGSGTSTGGKTTNTGGGATNTGGSTTGVGGSTVGMGGQMAGDGGAPVDAGIDAGATRNDARASPDVPMDASPGRDGVADASTEDAPVSDGGGHHYSGLPQPVCVWNEAYQENYAADTVAEILAGARNCYVLIDPFANSAARTAIGQMQQSGNAVGCYISVGTCEDWRDDFAAMKPYCVSKQWGDWPGEYFVDRTDPALVALMEARIDKMAAWGCDLVEFDNMDWTFDSAYRSQYGITATAVQGEAYNAALCTYTHGKGMGCMAKSSAQGAADFDGLTVESSPTDMDWWTRSDMQGMLSSGKIGIVVHYDESDCAAILSHYQSEYGSKLSFICEDRVLKKYRHFP